MLAIQYIRMYWEKDNRSPKGAVCRRDFFRPVKIEDTVDLSIGNKDVFLQKRWYIQTNQVYSYTDYNRIYRNRMVNAFGPTDAKREERIRKYLLEQNTAEHEDKGVFLADTNELFIPGIEIEKIEDGYRVKWYSLADGYVPVRTGYNENYSRKGTAAYGQRIKCETAFTLHENESGQIQYNYRYTGYHGQHYEQFCIYILNIDNLMYNSFIKADYKKVYENMVDLF